MGIYNDLRDVRGDVRKISHEILFNTFTYSLVTDTSDMTTVALARTPLRETPIARVKQLLGSQRLVELMESGGQLSVEAQPFFEISRAALKSGGIFHVPTTHDSFVQTGLTVPVFQVMRFIEIGTPPYAWLLIVNTEFRDHAGGGG